MIKEILYKVKYCWVKLEEGLWSGNKSKIELDVNIE